MNPVASACRTGSSAISAIRTTSPMPGGLCLWCLKLRAPRTMVQDAKRFICSSLLVQAFLVVGHPIATSQAPSVVPRDFESAAGFEVLM
jgi:hypothetical protein